VILTSLQGWARNFKNVALKKQNAICKLRVKYAIKHNCASKLFKAHCVATIIAKNAGFHKICLSAKNASIIHMNSSLAGFKLGSAD
jgi:hypothetical protein